VELQTGSPCTWQRSALPECSCFTLSFCLTVFPQVELYVTVSGDDGGPEGGETHERSASQVPASDPAVRGPRGRIVRVHGGRQRRPGAGDLVAQGQGRSGAGARQARDRVQPGHGRVLAGHQPRRAGRRRSLLVSGHQRCRSRHLHSQRRRRP